MRPPSHCSGSLRASVWIPEPEAQHTCTNEVVFNGRLAHVASGEFLFYGGRQLSSVPLALIGLLQSDNDCPPILASDSVKLHPPIPTGSG
jgi:hypothetical protein